MEGIKGMNQKHWALIFTMNILDLQYLFYPLHHFLTTKFWFKLDPNYLYRTQIKPDGRRWDHNLRIPLCFKIFRLTP